jgi:sugar phosphate isomerase/epimerase
MKTAISTSMFWKSASTAAAGCFGAIAAAGFDTIELDAHNLFNHLTAATVVSVADGLKNSGPPLSVSSVHMPYLYPLSSPSKSARASAVKSYARTVETLIGSIEASCLKPLTLVFHPGINTDKIPYADQKTAIEAGIKETGALFGSDRRFRLAFENMLSSHFAATSEDILFVAELAAAYCAVETGVCFDSCHAAYDYTAHEFLENIIGRVIAVHLSDNYNQSGGEFHAIPMSLIHSKIDWRRVAELLNDKIDIMTLELSKPPAISFGAYLKMTKAAADELESFAARAAEKV